MAAAFAIIIPILVFLVIMLLAVFTLYTRKRTTIPPDYYALYIMGLVWIIIGIPLGAYPLTLAGLVFVAIALYYKGRWGDRRPRWEELGEEEKRVRLAAIIASLFLLIGGILVLFLFEKKVIP